MNPWSYTAPSPKVDDAKSDMIPQASQADLPPDPDPAEPHMVAFYRLVDMTDNVVAAVIGHRTKAIAGGIPEHLADQMAGHLWGHMMSKVFQ